MLFTEIITRKRDDKTLSTAEIADAITGYVNSSVPDYQMSAFLMTIFIRGLSMRELRDLAQSMIDSGERYDLHDIPGMKIDKHSTGGVGDKISIILAPMVAAAGGIVPMIAGRGLGHTGGTIDKLEAIPNFKTRLSYALFRRQLSRIGVVISTQSQRLVPADRKLYALRDVTGTVESIPLIAASILSKKIASGNEGLVLDVKSGSGAFMPTAAGSRELAQTLVSLGRALGLKMAAYLTDMSQPLGCAIGNSLEINECLDALQGRGPADVMDLTLELGARMLLMGQVVKSMSEGRKKLGATIASGSAFERFLAMVAMQGGDVNAVDGGRHLPIARVQVNVLASRSGYITKIDTRAVGLAAVSLGAGRQRLKDKIDPAVGLVQLRKIGEHVQANDPIFGIHARTKTKAEEAVSRLQSAITIGENRPARTKLILSLIQ